MENKKPFLVSIALSTYNGEQYIRKQLDSLLVQTYPRLEIIVADDCSSDKTVEILREYERQDNRIKVFVNERNLGFNKNFEQAFGYCSGEYICISDQDDIWLPEKVEILYNNIGDNLLIYSNSILIDESGNELGRNKFRKMLPARNDPRAFSIRNTVAGHTVLFRKDLLDIALPIPNHCYYDWWMALVAANEGKITNRNLSLTKHRIHTSNASRGRELPQEEEYASMQQWIRSVLSLKNLRYREFFEELLRIFILEGTARDKALIRFQIKNNKIIYAKKSFFSRINSARKIGLSVMPAK